MSKVCKCCCEEKPDTAFYSSGTNVMSRCKECMALDRELTTNYNKYQYMPLNKWPVALIDDIITFKAYAEKGGKIDYAKSASTEAITLYDYLVALQKDTLATDDLVSEEAEQSKRRNDLVSALTEGSTVESLLQVIQELNATQNILQCSLSNLQATVKDVQQTLKEYRETNSKLQKKLDKQAKKALEDEVPKSFDTRVQEAKDRRRRRDLINKIGADKQVKELMAKEFPELLMDITAAYKEIQEQGYLSPKAIYKIVIPFEMYGYAIPLDLDEYYRTYLMPGIEAARQRDDYREMTDWLYDHIQNEHYNYYEEDWSNIPLAG